MMTMPMAWSQAVLLLLAPALLWVAWWLAERCQPYGVPRVSVYVAVGAIGALLGEAGGELAPVGLAGVAQFALALVLFELGCRIHLGWFRHNPWVLVLGVVQSAALFAAVWCGLAAVGVAGDWRPLLAAVAVAAAPAALLRVANDLRAAGQVTERALHLAAIQCVAAVLLVKMVTAHWYLSTAGDWGQAALSSIYALVLSVALGVAVAVLVAALVRGPFAAPVTPTVGYALALLWLTAVADVLRLSPLLAALSFGVMLRERRVFVANAQRDFGLLGQLLGVFLFVYVGSRLSWPALLARDVWLVAGVVLLARALLALPSGTTLRKGALTGVALLPMSAMTLLLLERSGTLGLPIAAAALWHLSAALLWLELLGPWLTQWALQAAREAPGAGAARRPPAVAGREV
jgi:Kef-type K+ transport system membrane component KefB